MCLLCLFQDDLPAEQIAGEYQCILAREYPWRAYRACRPIGVPELLLASAWDQAERAACCACRRPLRSVVRRCDPLQTLQALWALRRSVRLQPSGFE